MHARVGRGERPPKREHSKGDITCEQTLGLAISGAEAASAAPKRQNGSSTRLCLGALSFPFETREEENGKKQSNKFNRDVHKATTEYFIQARSEEK